MKKFLTLLLLSIAALGATAQSTVQVRGAVVDRDGNPIPGAEVRATNGAESTISADDGTFSLEVSKYLKSLTASYPGMEKKKLKTKLRDEMVFTLEPKYTGWFANATVGASFMGDGVAKFGIMAGYLGKWGGYAKIAFPLHSGDTYGEGMQYIVGVINHLKGNWYINWGAGYDGYLHYHSDSSGEIPCFHGMFGFDLGVIYRIDKINIGLGGSIPHGPYATVGYCF